MTVLEERNALYAALALVYPFALSRIEDINEEAEESHGATDRTIAIRASEAINAAALLLEKLPETVGIDRAVDAIAWVLRDAKYKAPEQVTPEARRWLGVLESAVGQ